MELALYIFDEGFYQSLSKPEKMMKRFIERVKRGS
jgi:hypothetical protein